MHTHTPHTLFLYAQNKYFKSEVKERKRNAVYMRTDAGHNPVGMFLACLLSGGLRIDNTVNTKHNATAA